MLLSGLGLQTHRYGKLVNVFLIVYSLKLTVGWDDDLHSPYKTSYKWGLSNSLNNLKYGTLSVNVNKLRSFIIVSVFFFLNAAGKFEIAHKIHLHSW